MTLVKNSGLLYTATTTDVDYNTATTTDVISFKVQARVACAIKIF
jgi:hypothetical protein